MTANTGGILPSVPWSLRKPCDACGYSFTSCGTPAAVSTPSRRAAAPRNPLSLPPKLPTTGQAPRRTSGE
jgi:hypothetical protein